MNLTANQIIRNIKLYELSGMELDKLFKRLYNVLKSDFTNLNIYKVNSHDKYVRAFSFYGNNKEDIIFMYDNGSKLLFVNYLTYKKLEMSEDDACDLIHEYLKNDIDIDEVVILSDYGNLKYTNYLEFWKSFGYKLENVYLL